ncbi:MAG: FAD-dependent oxidoreductase [Candidatus Eremiobacteraeota bacterium]|nr:FAD-dependent oxidoreductase [Candidatus Eremiobacteraeota bacterium]
MRYEVVVLGAGINGLATAYSLKRQGVSKLAVLEQFQLGHTQGSSHGRSRITRSTYSTPKYVELMQLVHGRLWPAWEEAAGHPLLHKNPGIFFGPGLGHYQESLRELPSVRVEEIAAAEARRRFPPFLFPDSQRVLVDHTCAVVAADRTMRFLAGQLHDHVLENCQVQSIDQGPQIFLNTTRGGIECERLVVTAGPWTSRLLPGLKPNLRPAHQDVGYFEIEASGRVGDFPVWVYAGEQADDSFYGLPEFERAGVKLARHRTGPHGDDPDRAIGEVLPPAAAADLQNFVTRQWSGTARLVGYDACIYTNTCSEDFILDHLPEDPRVVVGAGFSGHGFKFAPLTGQVLAELALFGRTSFPEFERHRQAFGFATAVCW